MTNFECISSFGYQDYEQFTKRLSRLGVPYRVVDISDRVTHGFNLYAPEDVVELCRELLWEKGLTDDEFYKRLSDQTLENGCIQVITL
jgi:hypothetical protein